MNIALINEDSQSEKNGLIFEVLSEEASRYGHTVRNYGMYGPDDPHEINFTQLGIIASVLLETGMDDFVVTGCGTGQGAMISCNAFSNLVCGYVRDPLDAFLFSQVNAGNAISIPFAQAFGWGSEVNLRYVFRSLFEQEFGGGYPARYAKGEKASRTRMRECTKLPAQRPLIDALRNMNRETLRSLFDYDGFISRFQSDAGDCEVSRFIGEILEIDRQA